MKRAGAAVLVVVSFLLTSPLSADEALVSIGDRAYLTRDNGPTKISYLRYPTLGCPAIVVRGTGGSAYVRLPDNGGTNDFQLSISSNGDALPQTFALPVTGITFDSAQGLYIVRYLVPSSVPEDMYDLQLVIPSRSVSDKQFNSFKVMASQDSNFTFVVLADTQFNDPRGMFDPGNYNRQNYNAAQVFAQMKQEVRNLNPTFAIVCGDLLFGLNYDYEYEGAWNVWKDAGFPVFMVPGNHDGYASTEERSILGIKTKVYDGIEMWRRYFGPNYFSFEWGGLHFQGVNSFDGTALRRDSFLIVNENYGGEIAPEQMQWLSWDAGSTTKPLIPYMHHNPLGPYHPNRDFGSQWTWIVNRAVEFLTTGNLDDYLSQTWNDVASADFLKATFRGRAPSVFLGHWHHDALAEFEGSIYRTVTDVASMGKGYWGYAIVRAENGRLVRHLYQDTSFMSVPIGNLFVNHVTPGEGTVPTASAEIKSGLITSYDVTLEFVVQSSPYYAAENGVVTGSSPLGDGRDKVWVRAATPTAASIETPQVRRVTVKPGTAPVVPPPSVHPTTGVAGSFESSRAGSQGRRFGCGAVEENRGAFPGLLILTILLLGSARLRRS